MKRRKPGDARGATPSETAPFNAPFARLADRLGAGPGADQREHEAPPPAVGPPAVPPAPPARAVVRLERKGRGGKEATVVEKLELDGAGRATWLRDLKQALGCGGAVEGDALVLQGDLRHRVKALLEARGVRKVTLG